MPDEDLDRRPSNAPWITAAVALAVLIALLVTYLVALRPDKQDADRRAAAGPQAGQLTGIETTAMNAAGTEMINLLTFRRAHFEADFQRALAGTTGPLRSDVKRKKADTLKAMTQGKFDLSARLTHKALEGPVGTGGHKGYVVLITVNGYRSTAPDVPSQQNLAVTVVNVDGNWLASDVKYVGVQ